jgi:hypothetical protein
MSKRTRALVFGVTLAAMNLAGLTAASQAQPSDEPAGNQDARRPPTERQVGEPYRNYHEALAAQVQTAQDNAAEQFRRAERAAQEQSTTAEAVEEFRRGERASQQQPTTDNPTPTPAPLQPDQPTGRPGWLVVSLAMLAATLAVVAGLALVAARRASRRARVGQAA